MDTLIEKAAATLRAAQHVLVFTGAGVSAESGISTFRDAQTGLWSRFDPATLASQKGFARNPGFVWQWYMERLGAMESALPNDGHRALAALGEVVPTLTLATQNIDNLHERAGSHPVLHMHGSIARFHCNGCAGSYTLRAEDRLAQMPPVCPLCGDWVRPSVVWFGEMLPEGVLDECFAAARQCDVLVVVGTSAVVYPAAFLPDLAHAAGATVIDVNPEPNHISDAAHIYLQGAGGVVLPRLVAAMELSV